MSMQELLERIKEMRSRYQNDAQEYYREIDDGEHEGDIRMAMAKVCDDILDLIKTLKP